MMLGRGAVWGRRHMFYDGVFDNLDGMKFVSPGECCLRGRVRDSSHSAFWGPGRTVPTHPVPIEMFMDYVPDIAAFKVLNFKGADSYLCVVRSTACAQLRPPLSSESLTCTVRV